jgi:hypothetical protein
MSLVAIKENSRIARLAAWKLKSNNVAIVLGNKIHLFGVSKEEFIANENWLKHELKHVQQFEKHGYYTFLIKYLWQNIFHGYHNCRFEKEAREAENDETLLALYKIDDSNKNLA